jgi:hypothetical protein
MDPTHGGSFAVTPIDSKKQYPFTDIFWLVAGRLVIGIVSLACRAKQDGLTMPWH